MKKYFFKLVLILLLPLGILLNYFSKFYPNLVETIYSSNINKTTIEILSKITDFIPFSLYEVTVITVLIVFITYLYFSIRKLVKNKNIWKITVISFILNLCCVVSIFYFLFIILWGLNYNRIPIEVSMGFQTKEYSVEDLSELYEYLINNVNLLRDKINVDKHNITTIKDGYKSVLDRAYLGYDEISITYPILGGNYGSPKPLIFSEFFNYTGITGIYFPYTGQPGLAINAPLMTLPSTTLHEMAHQRGYAREEDANFISFIVCDSHPDIDFKYSGYMLALSHTSNALYKVDPLLLKELNKNLSEDVKRDIQYKKDFWKKYDGKIEKIASNINDSYLKSNGVKDGEKSYGRMVDLLVNYYISVLKQ